MSDKGRNALKKILIARVNIDVWLYHFTYLPFIRLCVLFSSKRTIEYYLKICYNYNVNARKFTKNVKKLPKNAKKFTVKVKYFTLLVFTKTKHSSIILDTDKRD